MKKILLFIVMALYTGLTITAQNGTGLRLQNFKFAQDGEVYYAIPVENAAQIELKGRRYLQQKEDLQFAYNELVTYKGIVTFINDRLDEVTFNLNQTEKELTTLKYNYGVTLNALEKTETNNVELRIKNKELKKKITSLKWYLGTGIGAMIGTIVLAILI